MIKRIISLVLSVLFLLPIMAGAVSAAETKRPDAYDIPMLTIGDETITYEFFRYYYLTLQKSNEENKTEMTKEEILEEIISELKRNVAIDMLIKEYKISLEEESEQYGQYASQFSDSMLSSMFLTQNSFLYILLTEGAYGKLLEHFADEKSNALDFSSDAIKAYMSEFRSAFTIVIQYDEKNEEASKQLADMAYAQIKLDAAFITIREIAELSDELTEVQILIDSFSDSTAADPTGVTKEELEAKAADIQAKITEKSSALDISTTLTNYISALGSYTDYVKSELNELTKDDQELKNKINSDSETLMAYIKEKATEKILSVVNSKLKEISEDKINYIWLSSSFKALTAEFAESSTEENADKLIDAIDTDKDLYEDESLSSISTMLKAFKMLGNSEADTYEILNSLTSINNIFKLDITSYVSSALYATCIDASAKAEELKSAGTYSELSPFYDMLEAPVLTVEEIAFVYNAADENGTSGAAPFYFKETELIPELKAAIEGLNVGDCTGVIKANNAFQILKLTENDPEYFKENEYASRKFQDALSEIIDKLTVTEFEEYKSLSDEKVNEYEAEIKKALEAETNKDTSSNDDFDPTVIWVVIIIAITVAVVAVLAVLIVASGKPESTNASGKNKNKK